MDRHLFRIFTTVAVAAACFYATLPSVHAAEPVAAKARPILHLSRTQAELFDRAMPGRVIWVEVDCCTPASLLDAVATAEILRIAGSLTHAAPVFLTGRDARHAAFAAERIVAAGMPLVFIVADDSVAMADDALETP